MEGEKEYEESIVALQTDYCGLADGNFGAFITPPFVHAAEPAWDEGIVSDVSASDVLTSGLVSASAPASESDTGSRDGEDTEKKIDIFLDEIPMAAAGDAANSYMFVGDATTFIDHSADSFIKDGWSITSYSWSVSGDSAVVTNKTYRSCQVNALTSGRVTLSYYINLSMTDWYYVDVQMTQKYPITRKESFRATWVIDISEKHVVSLDANGGSVSPSKVEVGYGGGFTYGELPIPKAALTGYVFDGWYTEKEGGSRITKNSVVSINADHTLYAQWVPEHDYTIRFDGNGSTGGEMDDMRCAYGQSYRLSANGFKKSGHRFVGWSADKDGVSGTAYANREWVSNLCKEDRVFTLYAQWSDANIATGVIDGTNITWAITAEGTLIVSGNGEIPSQKYSDFSWWRKYADDVVAIIVEDEITGIGDYAFYNMAAVENVQLLGNITSLGDSSFFGCESLESIQLPDSVTYIGSYAFSWCSSLETIELPDSLETIGMSAFYGCSSLKTIELPDSVVHIEEHAFEGCTSLETIELSDSLETIDIYVFSSCSSLKTIELPDSVTTIEGCAFEYCSGIEEIRIPASVKYIGDIAFIRMDNLKNIIVDEENSEYADVDGVLFNKAKTEIVAYPEGHGDVYVIPDGVTRINEITKIKKLIVPATVKSLGAFCFSSNKYMEIYFRGAAPELEETVVSEVNTPKSFAFDSATATIYYPSAYQSSWIAAKDSYNNAYFWGRPNLTWSSFHLHNTVADCTVTLLDTEAVYEYDGTEKKPRPVVEDEGVILEEGVDYSLSYRDNINAGTATVIVKGEGGYSGEVEKTFTIRKAQQHLVVNRRTQELTVGETLILEDVSGIGDITYQSSNPEIAEVSDKGVITAKKAGKAVITVRASGDANHDEAEVELEITVKSDAVEEPSESSSESSSASEPSSQPSEPSSQPSEPSSQPSEPSSQPSEPSSQPSEPSSQPSEPSSEASKESESPEDAYKGEVSDEAGGKRLSIEQWQIEESGRTFNTDSVKGILGNYTGQKFVAISLSVQKNGKGNQIDKELYNAFIPYLDTNAENYRIDYSFYSEDDSTDYNTIWNFNSPKELTKNISADTEMSVQNGAPTFSVKSASDFKQAAEYVSVNFWTRKNTTLYKEISAAIGNERVFPVYPADSKTALKDVGADWNTDNYGGWINVGDVRMLASGKTYHIGKPSVTENPSEPSSQPSEPSSKPSEPSSQPSTPEVDAQGMDVRFVDEKGVEHEPGKYHVTYNGAAIKPTVRVTNNGKDLVEGIDYTVKYKNNTNAGSDAQVIVTGKGNFSGAANALTFTIKAAVLGVDVSVPASMTVVKNTKVAPVLMCGAKKLGAKDFDMTGDGLTNFKYAETGEHTLTVTGKGTNYTGSETIKVNVVEKGAFTKLTVKVDSAKAKQIIYDGREHTPAMLIADGTITLNSAEMAEGTDYEIVCGSDTTSAGTVKFTIVGCGTYSGSVAKSYKINPVKDGSKLDIKVVDEEDNVIEGTPKAEYRAAGAKPAGFAITFKNDADSKEVPLTEGRDYKVSYSGNKKADANAKYTITFLGNYKGCKPDAAKGTYKVEKAMATMAGKDANTTVVIPDKPYMIGKAHKSTPIVMVNGEPVKSSNYEVSYAWALEDSTDYKEGNRVTISEGYEYATVRVTIDFNAKNKGSYKQDANEKIEGYYYVRYVPDATYDLSKAKVTFKNYKGKTIKNLEYNGREYDTPDGNKYDSAQTYDPNDVFVEVTVKGTPVSEELYDVVWTNSTAKGKATVVINGTGNPNAKNEVAVGSKNASISIKALNFKGKDLKGILNKMWNNVF